MNNIPPPIPTPKSTSPMEVLAWMRSVTARLDWLSRMPPPQFGAGGSIPAAPYEDRKFCFGKIRDDGGSGAWSQSLHNYGVTNPAGVGFYLPNGFLAYAFDQVYDDTPWEGIEIVNGIKTRFGDAAAGSPDGQSVVNAAVTLNGETWRRGDVVFLVKCPPHWSIIGRPSPRDVDIVCDDETGTATIIKEP